MVRLCLNIRACHCWLLFKLVETTIFLKPVLCSDGLNTTIVKWMEKTLIFKTKTGARPDGHVSTHLTKFSFLSFQQASGARKA